MQRANFQGKAVRYGPIHVEGGQSEEYKPMQQHYIAQPVGAESDQLEFLERQRALDQAATLSRERQPGYYKQLDARVTAESRVELEETELFKELYSAYKAQSVSFFDDGYMNHYKPPQRDQEYDVLGDYIPRAKRGETVERYAYKTTRADFMQRRVTGKTVVAEEAQTDSAVTKQPVVQDANTVRADAAVQKCVEQTPEQRGVQAQEEHLQMIQKLTQKIEGLETQIRREQPLELFQQLLQACLQSNQALCSVIQHGAQIMPSQPLQPATQPQQQSQRAELLAPPVVNPQLLVPPPGKAPKSPRSSSQQRRMSELARAPELKQELNKEIEVKRIESLDKLERQQKKFEHQAEAKLVEDGFLLPQHAIAKQAELERQPGMKQMQRASSLAPIRGSASFSKSSPSKAFKVGQTRLPAPLNLFSPQKHSSIIKPIEMQLESKPSIEHDKRHSDDIDSSSGSSHKQLQPLVKINTVRRNSSFSGDASNLLAEDRGAVEIVKIPTQPMLQEICSLIEDGGVRPPSVLQGQTQIGDQSLDEFIKPDLQQEMSGIPKVVAAEASPSLSIVTPPQKKNENPFASDMRSAPKDEDLSPEVNTSSTALEGSPVREIPTNAFKKELITSDISMEFEPPRAEQKKVTHTLNDSISFGLSDSLFERSLPRKPQAKPGVIQWADDDDEL